MQHYTSYFLLLRQKESNQRKGAPGLPPLRGSLDISPTSGAAQLALAGHTNRAPLRSSDITSDLAEVFFQPSRMASCFISARLHLRLLAKYRGGAQGMENENLKPRRGHFVPTQLG